MCKSYNIYSETAWNLLAHTLESIPQKIIQLW